VGKHGLIGLIGSDDMGELVNRCGNKKDW